MYNTDIKNKIIIRISFLVSLLLLSFSCSEEKEAINFVDLRYEVEERYELSALNPDPIKFKVKSTKEWSVFSKHHAEWSTVSPDSGIPDEAAEVTVIYAENKDLDDRIDTLVIKSDYWIGKEVEVFQKGTAYLTIEKPEKMLSKDGGETSFTINANQKWKIKFSSDYEWLTLISEDAGERDGIVRLSATPNVGERRTAQIEAYDRNGLLAGSVEIVQDGIQLDIEQKEIKVEYNQQSCQIAVHSNTKWKIIKDDNLWYSLSDNETEFTNDHTIIINLEENKTPNVRVAYLKVQSVGDDENPVVREICLKQAYLPTPEHHEFDSQEKGNWEFINGNLNFTGDVLFAGSASPRMSKYKVGLGKYMFNVKSITPTAFFRIYILSGEREIRYFLDATNGTTSFSTRPYTPINGDPKWQVPFDRMKENRVGVELSSSDDGMMCIKWILNDQVICEQVANYGDFALTPDKKMDIVIDAKPGDVVLDYWEYSLLMDWNNIGL